MLYLDDSVCYLRAYQYSVYIFKLIKCRSPFSVTKVKYPSPTFEATHCMKIYIERSQVEILLLFPLLRFYPFVNVGIYVWLHKSQLYNNASSPMGHNRSPESQHNVGDTII